jgi:uncharacterized membrane protein
MLEHGILQNVIKWAVAPLAVVVWWFFRRHANDMQKEIQELKKEKDLIKTDIAVLKTSDAVIQAHLNHLVNSTSEIKKSIEKLDEKLSK